MDEVQFADGIDAPDRLAFGLGAGQLLVVVAGAMLAYALARAPLPTGLGPPLALTVAALAAALGWLRLAGRPALDWALFAGRFLAQSRAGSLDVTSADAPPVDGAAMPAHGEALPATRGLVVPLRRYAVGDAGAVPALRTATPPARRLRIGGAHRITLFSLKGGTGRTTLATELACLLADPSSGERLRVALVDLDTRSASVAVRLGMACATVADYALAPPEGRCAAGFMTEHGSGAHVMLGTPRPSGGDWPLNAGVVRDLLRDLDVEGFDIVITDVAAELSALTAAVITSADDVLVVLNATPGGVQDAYRTTEQLRRLGVRHQLRFVVNRARAGVDFATAMSDLAGHVIAEIPDDPAVLEAEDRQRCVADAGGAAADALHRLARRVRRELAMPRHA
ncbi:MAG: hypothetical protein JOZ46_11960 [Candidatus Dormibacteraeota bacterium]|nr:hypothetical protein [Candidatus Dormibacteraeota bacterium]MBV9526515.1 hypothetical protein [Candidatus Dormibacteraeota bacterium]